MIFQHECMLYSELNIFQHDIINYQDLQPLLFSLRADSTVMTFILQATAAKALKNNNDMSAAMDSLLQETFFSSHSKDLLW